MKYLYSIVITHKSCNLTANSIASAEGQRIYTIKSTNLATVLQEMTIDQAVKDEITQAVNAGYEVTTSQHPITRNGWTGVGYIIIDPQTGSGAYKISGGSDGAIFFAQVSIFTVFLFGAVAATSTLGLVWIGITSVFAMASYMSAVTTTLQNLEDGTLNATQAEGMINLYSVFAVGASFLGVLRSLNRVGAVSAAGTQMLITAVESFLQLIEYMMTQFAQD